jgi:hypothetical protein
MGASQPHSLFSVIVSTRFDAKSLVPDLAKGRTSLLQTPQQNTKLCIVLEFFLATMNRAKNFTLCALDRLQGTLIGHDFLSFSAPNAEDLNAVFDESSFREPHGFELINVVAYVRRWSGRNCKTAADQQ